MLFSASVPMTQIFPDVGFTLTAMQMFIKPLAYLTEKVEASITARSWSGMSQPGTRPVNAAFEPRMYSVQSPLLSSIQRTALFFFTIKLTCGGGLVSAGFMAGTKLVPLLCAGFCPPEEAYGKLTVFARGKPCETPVPIMVLALPDSKTAA